MPITVRHGPDPALMASVAYQGAANASGGGGGGGAGGSAMSQLAMLRRRMAPKLAERDAIAASMVPKLDSQHMQMVRDAFGASLREKAEAANAQRRKAEMDQRFADKLDLQQEYQRQQDDKNLSEKGRRELSKLGALRLKMARDRTYRDSEKAEYYAKLDQRDKEIRAEEAKIAESEKKAFEAEKEEKFKTGSREDQYGNLKVYKQDPRTGKWNWEVEVKAADRPEVKAAAEEKKKIEKYNADEAKWTRSEYEKRSKEFRAALQKHADYMKEDNTQPEVLKSLENDLKHKAARRDVASIKKDWEELAADLGLKPDPVTSGGPQPAPRSSAQAPAPPGEGQPGFIGPEQDPGGGPPERIPGVLPDGQQSQQWTPEQIEYAEKHGLLPREGMSEQYAEQLRQTVMERLGMMMPRPEVTPEEASRRVGEVSDIGPDLSGPDLGGGGDGEQVIRAPLEGQAGFVGPEQDPESHPLAFMRSLAFTGSPLELMDHVQSSGGLMSSTQWEKLGGDPRDYAQYRKKAEPFHESQKKYNHPAFGLIADKRERQSVFKQMERIMEMQAFPERNAEMTAKSVAWVRELKAKYPQLIAAMFSRRG